MNVSRSAFRPAAWRFRAALQWNRLILIGLEEVSRVQVQAVRDARVMLAIRSLADSTAESVGDVTMLLKRQGSRPLPLTGVTRGACWAAGCLVALMGEQAVVRFDRWLVERWVRACTRTARWIPPEDGITARALEAVREREAGRLRALAVTRTPLPRRPRTRRRGQ